MTNPERAEVRLSISAEEGLTFGSIDDYVRSLPPQLSGADQEARLARIREAGIAAEILQGLINPEDRAETYRYLRTIYNKKYALTVSQQASAGEAELARRKRMVHLEVGGWLGLASKVLRHAGDTTEPRIPAREELPLLINEGERALTTFWESNLRLAVSMAARFKGKGVSFVELIQVANLALKPVIDRFDYKRGFKFSTYAFIRLRGDLLKYIMNANRIVRLPDEFIEDMQKVQTTRGLLVNEGHDNPSPELLAGLIGLSVEGVKSILSKEWMFNVMSTNRSARNDSDSLTELGDLIASPTLTPEEVFISEDVIGLMGSLDERTRRIVSLRLGLFDGEARTYQQIGDILGLSRTRIEQLYKKGIQKLQQSFKKEMEQ